MWWPATWLWVLIRSTWYLILNEYTILYGAKVLYKFHVNYYLKLDNETFICLLKDIYFKPRSQQ